MNEAEAKHNKSLTIRRNVYSFASYIINKKIQKKICFLICSWRGHELFIAKLTSYANFKQIHINVSNMARLFLIPCISLSNRRTSIDTIDHLILHNHGGQIQKKTFSISFFFNYFLYQVQTETMMAFFISLSCKFHKAILARNGALLDELSIACFVFCLFLTL